LNISVQAANLSDCRIESKKIDSVARIESNRNFFCPNWNALAAISRQLSRCASSVRRTARQLVGSVAQRRRHDVAATSATDADVLPTSTTSFDVTVFTGPIWVARDPPPGKGQFGGCTLIEMHAAIVAATRAAQ